MTIEEIYHYEDLSVRSFNVCNVNGLKDLQSILKYYRENRTFDNLRNCGRKSSDELKALCLKYIDYDNNYCDGRLRSEKQFIPAITNFSRAQREIVNSFIEINTNNLSNRSKNAIISFLNGNLKIRNISEKILNNNGFDFQDIKNVGIKTVSELTFFFNSIIDFIEKVDNVKKENELVALRNRFFIEKTFSISSISNEILESQSIFRLVDFLMGKDAIFDKNENIIFQKAFKIYNNQPELKLDEIARTLNITRERVRQIRKGILENLFSNLQFLKNLNDDIYQKYSLDENQQFINVDEDLNKLINQTNDTNFSAEFNTILIYSYISNKFELLGNTEDVLQPKTFNSKGRHNWNNFYLVSQNLTNLFDFNNFVDDIDKRMNDRIEETYWFNFKSYLSNFMKVEDSSRIKSILSVAEKVLNYEFGIYIDTDDNIRFTRNSLKQAYEYAYEALKLLGKPSKVNEITKKIEELHPDYETNEVKVRVSMKRQNGFVPIGRRSIFGLKEWENQLENFKGGTIRSIVSEYLESEVDPKHISEITDYVLNYRPNTYERSILDNLKADEAKTFIFFQNSRIGLRIKKYDNVFEELNQIDSLEHKSWEERYNDFVQFVNVNNRLPFSSGCPNEEVRLYRWYKTQDRKIKKGELDNQKGNLLKQITIQFNINTTNHKNRLKNVERYVELKQFILLNNRLPSANKAGEDNLYQFLYKQRKLFEKGKLGQSDIDEFIQIAKIIQNHTHEDKRN